MVIISGVPIFRMFTVFTGVINHLLHEFGEKNNSKTIFVRYKEMGSWVQNQRCYSIAYYRQYMFLKSSDLLI